MDEVFGNVDFVRVEIMLAQNLLCDFVWGKYRWWFGNISIIVFEWGWVNNIGWLIFYW